MAENKIAKQKELLHDDFLVTVVTTVFLFVSVIFNWPLWGTIVFAVIFFASFGFLLNDLGIYESMRNSSTECKPCEANVWHTVIDSQVY